MTEHQETSKQTGSEFIDMINARSEHVALEVTERYRRAEARIAESVGEVALIVVRREEQNLEDRGKLWVPQSPQIKLYAGRISGAAPVVDPKSKRWAIPTKQYLVQVRGKAGVSSKEGPMPVDDFVPKPADPAVNSSLGQEVYREAMEYTYGEEDSHLGVTTVRCRLSKQTSLFIGLGEISKTLYEPLARQID
jgi:hypothetical protein